MARRRRPSFATRRPATRVLDPFRVGTRLHPPLVALYVLVNGVVLANALLHHPAIGYDALDHLRYIRVLAHLRLPTPPETLEFFSPPLAYLAPALLDASGLLSFPAVAKTAQLLNVVLSLLLTLGLLRLCDLVRPGSRLLKPAALGLLGLLPVYYKTFAFVRPEPLLACLGVWSACGIVRVFARGDRALLPAAALGVTLGLLLLTRQQAVLWVAGAALAALLSLWQRPADRVRRVRVAVLVFLVAAIVGGWFYLHLSRAYGSPAAFNRPRAPFSLANRPRTFYLGLGGRALFQDPIRPSFRLELWPKLYSEAWGDHETYFLVYGRDRRNGALLSGGPLETALVHGTPDWLDTNRYRINGYLGRVNLVSLLPSAILLGGGALGLAALVRVARRHAEDPGHAEAVLTLLVAISVAGYLVLLVMFPTGSGDTVKATYLVHVFPLLAVLGGGLLDRLHGWSPRAGRAAFLALAAVAVHNLGAVVTRYSGAVR